jgi:hypothetical protein
MDTHIVLLAVLFLLAKAELAPVSLDTTWI